MRLLNWFSFKKKKITQYHAVQFQNFINSGCVIIFSNESKVQSHFIEGSWSKVYSKYQNLDEMRVHLHSQFHRQTATDLPSIDIGGFSPFYRAGNSWVSENARYGKIYITFHNAYKAAVA